ncbi:MAG: HEAT repeat domain-containing protein, partial [Candidatus Deferrimicrobiaceae bacterium]
GVPGTGHRRGRLVTFPRPCENAFDALAATDRDRLLAWVTAGELGPAHLTYALEALGRSGHPLAALVLLHSANHAHPLVREGAVLGLDALGVPGASHGLVAELAESDPSPGVRAVCRDVLDEDADGGAGG